MSLARFRRLQSKILEMKSSVCLLSALAVSSSCSLAHAFTTTTSTSTTTSGVTIGNRRLPFTTSLTEKLFKNDVYDTIQNGKIAVIPEFLPSSEIAALRRDAGELHEQHLFSTDALASYGSSGKFDPTKDRTVLKLKQWKNQSLGNYDTRKSFAARMADLRADLSLNLNRPALVQGDAVNKYGQGSTEISYTRFGPGAFLKRHVDENHEELKGTAGWSQPTRRSLSWLIYLNDPDWNADKHGGCLRCFERNSPTISNVGARSNGDLQIGWLKGGSQNDPYDRPVFLDGARPGDMHCAMYIDGSVPGEKEYITKDFNANPLLYSAGSELIAQNVLVQRKDYAKRFQFLELPKSILTEAMNQKLHANDETAVDIPPTGGTLVVFDSVALPHEVLATIGRERWATSGWYHEDQQAVENHPHYNYPSSSS